MFKNPISWIDQSCKKLDEYNTKIHTDLSVLSLCLLCNQIPASQQIDKVRKQHDLEQQLADAKLSKSDLQLKELTERSQKEKELVSI